MRTGALEGVKTNNYTSPGLIQQVGLRESKVYTDTTIASKHGGATESVFMNAYSVPSISALNSVYYYYTCSFILARERLLLLVASLAGPPD